MANEILLKAANILEDKGWVQHAYRNNEGYCAVGAINSAAEYKEDANHHFAIKCLAKYLNVQGDIGVIRYNDLPTTTAEDVINAMRKAAETC